VPPCLRVRRENSPLDCFLTLLTPLPFALDLDASAVDQQVQRAAGFTVGNIDLQGLLAPRRRAEVGHGPVQAGQAQQALNEAPSPWSLEPSPIGLEPMAPRWATVSTARSARAPCQTAPSSSGRSGWLRHYSQAVGHVCLFAWPPRSSRDRTRSSASHDASELRSRRANSWSCRRGGWVGSCAPSYHAGFTR